MTTPHDQQPEHKTPKKKSGMLVTLIAIAGVIAGAAAIYGMKAFNGNDGTTTDHAMSCPASLDPVVRAAIKGQVAAMIPTQNAHYAGDIAITNPDGTASSLAQFSDKVVLVNLWATWCAPCRREMPHLAKLQKEMGSDDFSVVAINIDTGDQKRAKEFLTKVKADNLAFYSDQTAKVFETLQRRGKAFGMPVTMLLDRKGCEMAAMNGPAEWHKEDAKALISTALKAK